ncbi:MAG: hypothetical protein ACLFQM_12160 [Fidelibacterota bacterium]
MKDFIIPARRIKTELYKLLIFFIVANILNIFSIIKYHTKWVELFTQFHWVLILTVFMYLISLLILGIKLLILYVKTGKLML